MVLAIMMFGVAGCGLMNKEPKVEINHKIVGKWSTTGVVGEPIVWNFIKDGTMVWSMNGKDAPAQKYKMIDDATVELETKSGTKSEFKTEFSNNDNTMTMTGGIGNLKTTFKRE